jgi:hypothetical protein
MPNREELKIVGKLLLGLLYLFALYLAPQVLRETFTIFDYGRF